MTAANGFFAGILNHQGFRRYFFNTFWMLLENFMVLLSGLFVGVWVARYLGPQELGVFSYVIAVTSIFAGIAKLGLDDIVTQELISRPHESETIMGTALWLKFAGGMVTFFLVAVLMLAFEAEYSIRVFIFLVAAGLPLQSLEVVDFCFQARVNAKPVTIARIFQLLVSVVIRVGLIIGGAGLLWFFVVNLVNSVTLAAAYLFALRRNYQQLHIFRRFDAVLAKNMLHSSWPLIFSALVIMIYMRIDSIMIKEMLGQYDAGIYSAAVKLSEIWYFLPFLLAKSLFPAVINARKISEEFFARRITRLYLFMGGLGTLLAVICVVLAGPIVTLVYGDAFKNAAPVLVIHAWCLIPVFIGGVVARSYILAGLSYQKLLGDIIGAVINVCLNYVLIRRYGVEGAAIASFIAYSYICILHPLILNFRSIYACLSSTLNFSASRPEES
jgi:O-antigen/teichoic acid export membrane protein